jgi:hypothetical protein
MKRRDKMRIIRWGSRILAASSLVGCATSFTGNAHVENGRAGCEEKCKGQGMQVAGMVYMGEYSSACVCEVPHGSASSSRREFLLGSAGSSGGAVGVVMQMRRQEQPQQHSMFTFH